VTGASGDLPIVDGATRLYGIIGHPIDQVKSPELITPKFRATGRNALMLPMHVTPERFDETVRGLKALANLDGIVITVPYKVRIIPHIDRLLPTGERIGAINAMRREADGTWVGDMFDGRGLVRGLSTHGHNVAGKRVLLLGAGGAGSAIAWALAEAGAVSVTLHDVDEGRAGELAARVAKAYTACAIVVGKPNVQGHDILVNATPTGMTPGDGLPADFGALDPNLIVADIIMKPEVTPLLAHARACGCRTMPGRAMLEGQADELVGFFGMGA
jgi:shikimate dehydrogenase